MKKSLKGISFSRLTVVISLRIAHRATNMVWGKNSRLCPPQFCARHRQLLDILCAIHTTGLDHMRRACFRLRRRGPSPNFELSPQPLNQIWIDFFVYQPRPGCDSAYVRPHCRNVYGQNCRIRRPKQYIYQPATSLHGGFAICSSHG